MISFNVERFVNEDTSHTDNISFMAELLMENIDMSLYAYNHYSNMVFNESYITEGALGDFFGKIIKFIRELISRFLQWVKNVKNNIMSWLKKNKSSSNSTDNNKSPSNSNTKKELTPEEREKALQEKIRVIFMNPEYVDDVEDFIDDVRTSLSNLERPITDILHGDLQAEVLDMNTNEIIDKLTENFKFDINDYKSYMTEQDITLAKMGDMLKQLGDPEKELKKVLSSIEKVTSEFKNATDKCEKSIERDRRNIDKLSESYDNNRIQKAISFKVHTLSAISRVSTKIITSFHKAATIAAESARKAINAYREVTE